MEPNEINNVHMAPQRSGKPKDNLSIPIAIIFSGILIGVAIIFTPKPSAPLAQAEQAPARAQAGADGNNAPLDLLKLKPDDHILGNPNADVVIIEYTDAQCPFCQRYHETMLKVMDNYGKAGQVSWVYRHFPLDQLHPYARKGAEGLECANEVGGNAGFWKFEDKLFSPTTKSIAPTDLPALAKSVGIDETKFTNCLSSGKWAARVQRDFEEGVNVGVKGTPYTVVWNRVTGKQLAINGAYPYENVKAILGIVTASAQNPSN